MVEVKIRNIKCDATSITIENLEHVLIKCEGKYIILVFDGILLKDVSVFYSPTQVKNYFKRFNINLEVK